MREWLLCAAAVGLVASSIHLGRAPAFSAGEFEVLALLWVLFVSVRGLEDSGLLARISNRIERGGRVPLKLVALTFVLSMVVTNDVALVVVVPLTLALGHRHAGTLVILEALAANAGAALTPLGNPQNLFIYWVYQVDPREFVTTIAPFSGVFLAILLAGAGLVPTPPAQTRPASQPLARCGYAPVGLLVLVILAVLRVLPLWAAGVVPVWALVRNRRMLRVDYGLLLTFFCMFGLTDNLRLIFAARLEHAGHVFLLSALSSQFMSNVPATLLFAEFTSNWKELLWGVNVGGFGSLVASLANLIAYRLYVRHEPGRQAVRFTLHFVGLGYAMFLVGVGLYWILHTWLSTTP